jgi:hypothetical protein
MSDASGARRGRLVVLGMVGRTPFAGVAWQALHYLEGLRRLGYVVDYVEDTGDWPYDARRNSITDDVGYTLGYLDRLMSSVGLADHWFYRSAAQEGRVFGQSERALAEVLQRADGLINVTGATVLREEHLQVPVRIYLETDPVLPQIEVALGRQFTIDVLRAHTHLFTFGESLGQPDCGVPMGAFAYHTTRQPVVIDWWRTPPSPLPGREVPFTTVSNWKQTGKDIEWQGELYLWSKHHEFLRFLDLPRRTDQPLELALTAHGDPEVRGLLERHGWRVTDAFALTVDVDPYRAYVQGSRGEFTVAKDQYHRLRTGWFSDRSASYLSAGRPVITQETGFSRFLPTGRGLFAFTTMDDVVAALEAINGDYQGHCRAAGEIAAEYFDAEKVLRRLCDQAGL